MQPIDQPLTFEGHPDQARPLEAAELFGLHTIAPGGFSEWTRERMEEGGDE